MIGPIFFIGGYQIGVGNLPQFPLSLVDLLQIVLGLSAAAKITKERLIILKSMWIPALLVILWTIVLTVVMAWIINYYYPDPLTAFSLLLRAV